MNQTAPENTVVLIADDDFAAREVACNALSRIGYSCMTAQDGKQALEMTREHSFSLVISDLDMPQMGGLELIKILREESPDLPVVIMTSHTDIQTARQALQLQVVDYITKPFENIAELQAAVRRAVEIKGQRETSNALALELDARMTAPRHTATAAMSTQAAVPAQGSGYELKEMLGEGGMGKVYKAFQLSMERIVALKMLNPVIAQDASFVKRFIQEARVVARLDHPNIVKGFDAGQMDDTYYIAMEFIEGSSVGHLIDRERKVEEVWALEIALQVAFALKHIAEINLIHRDIKPDNILLTKNHVVKLTDLGIAREVRNDNPGLTAEGIAVGTLAYMSPEQMLATDLDIRSDIYSLGATLFHMTTGQLPFSNSTTVTGTMTRITEPPRQVAEIHPSISPVTSSLIAAMMEPKAENRQQTPDDLIRELQAVLRVLPPELQKSSAEQQSRYRK